MCTANNAVGIKSTAPFNDTPGSTVILPHYDTSLRYVLGPADLDGAAIATTTVSATPSGSYQVDMTLTPVGAERFDSVASLRYALAG